MRTFIILTSKAEHLAAGLGKNFELIFPEKNKEGQRFFPDGEIYESLPQAHSLKGNRVVVLHSGAPSPNDGLVELELILQILKDSKVKPEVFFTYFPYGRQDKIFQDGETNAAENLVRKIIEYYKVTKIYAIDPHFGKMPWLKKYPVVSISAVSLLTQAMKNDFGRNILFLSPDKGGKRRTGISGLNKKRIDSFKIELSPAKTNLYGKVIGIIDDILATGGTLSRFYDYAKESGAKKIIALITHGPVDSSIRRIKNIFFNLYLTNTINTKEANVDIVGLVVGALTKNKRRP